MICKGIYISEKSEKGGGGGGRLSGGLLSFRFVKKLRLRVMRRGTSVSVILVNALT